jgi:GNAT superfamily N-acetyltransferase
MVTILRAEEGDAVALTAIAKKAFTDDNKLKPKGASLEGPPGHDNVEKQKKWIQKCYYYKAIVDAKILGGGMAWKKNDDEYCIDGMFVDPDYQNIGIGSELIKHILVNHVPLIKWTLSTPNYAIRNQHFYEKYGFIKACEEDTDIGWKSIHYEKHV